MKFKRSFSLAAAALLCVGLLTGCAGDSQETAAPESTISMRNDGREAALVLGELELSPERTEALEEIVRKYRADFPKTEVEIRSFDTSEDLEKALRAGELDIAEINGGAQAALVKEGLLLDFYPYLKAWDESATLTPAAEQAVGSLGSGQAYLIPNGFTQDLLYYRADWFGEFNEGLEKDKDKARARSWDEIAGGPVAGEILVGASEKLGDRGKLAFAGREKLVDYFDAMVWSSVGTGRIADIGAAYFSAEGQGKTIFSLEKAQEGADEFLRVMEKSALPEALESTEADAVKAFTEGRAGMLLADRSAAETLREAMPEGSWEIAAFPRGRVGAAVFADDFSGWGIYASTGDAEIAAHFLTYLSNADNNTHYAKVCGVLPIHLEAAAMEPSLCEGELAVEMEMIQRGDWYQYVWPPVMYEAYQDYREQAGEKLRQFAKGELSRDELLGFLDDYWAQAYQEEGKLWK